MTRIEVPGIFFMRTAHHDLGDTYVFAVDPLHVKGETADITNVKPYEVRVPVPYDQDHSIRTGQRVMLTIEVQDE